MYIIYIYIYIYIYISIFLQICVLLYLKSVETEKIHSTKYRISTRVQEMLYIIILYFIFQ